jgi:hypothetical protein
MTLTLLTCGVALTSARKLPPQAARVAGPAAIVPPRTDLRGNDVRDAVATYKLDALGSLYEEHSPNAEIPKLGEPRS